MRTYILSLFCILILFFLYNSCKKAVVGKTQSCTNAPASSHPKGTLIQNLMDDYVKKGLPGIAVLIKDGSGIWYGAAGKSDLEQGIDYSPCTVQKLGSITKMMLGVLTMKLVEEGKVNLDDPISKWIDAKILKNIRNADQVSIRNCLQHTTGIFDIITSTDFYLAVLNDPNKHWTAEELLKYIENKPAVFAANQGVAYSNTNAIFVALCLEKITGKTHGELLHEKIFTPLGMHDTYYHWYDALPNTTAQGYYDIYGNNTIVNVSNIITGSGNGFTGVYSNVFDMQKFMAGVFLDKTILTQKSLDTMMQWKYAGEGVSFGLGLFQQEWGQVGEEAVGHTGGDLGYACEAYYYPYNKRYYISCVNYGTTTVSSLSPTYWEFIEKLNHILTQ